MYTLPALTWEFPFAPPIPDISDCAPSFEEQVAHQNEYASVGGIHHDDNLVDLWSGHPQALRGQYMDELIPAEVLPGTSYAK